MAVETLLGRTQVYDILRVQIVLIYTRENHRKSSEINKGVIQILMKINC